MGPVVVMSETNLCADTGTSEHSAECREQWQWPVMTTESDLCGWWCESGLSGMYQRCTRISGHSGHHVYSPGA